MRTRYSDRHERSARMPERDPSLSNGRHTKPHKKRRGSPDGKRYGKEPPATVSYTDVPAQVRAFVLPDNRRTGTCGATASGNGPGSGLRSRNDRSSKRRSSVENAGSPVPAGNPVLRIRIVPDTRISVPDERRPTACRSEQSGLPHRNAHASGVSSLFLRKNRRRTSPKHSKQLARPTREPPHRPQTGMPNERNAVRISVETVFFHHRPRRRNDRPWEPGKRLAKFLRINVIFAGAAVLSEARRHRRPPPCRGNRNPAIARRTARTPLLRKTDPERATAP